MHFISKRLEVRNLHSTRQARQAADQKISGSSTYDGLLLVRGRLGRGNETVEVDVATLHQGLLLLGLSELDVVLQAAAAHCL